MSASPVSSPAVLHQRRVEGALTKNSGIENVNSALLTLSIVYTSWLVGLMATPAGHTRLVAGPLMTPRGGTSPSSVTLQTPMNPVRSGSHGDGRASAWR